MSFGPFTQLRALDDAPGIRRFSARWGEQAILLLRLPLLGQKRAIAREQLRLEIETTRLKTEGYPILSSGALPRAAGGLELFWVLPEPSARPLRVCPDDLGAVIRWLIQSLEAGRPQPTLSWSALHRGPQGITLGALPLVARPELLAPECPPPALAPEEDALHLSRSGAAWRLGRALKERLGEEPAWEGLIHKLLVEDPGRRLALEAALARVEVGPWDGDCDRPATSAEVLAALDAGPRDESADPWADLRREVPSSPPEEQTFDLPRSRSRGAAWFGLALAVAAVCFGALVS